MPSRILDDHVSHVTYKGEFEEEGLSCEQIATEKIIAQERGCDYLVKIGGCAALSEIRFLEKIGVKRIVAPMIESPFAMTKYMQVLEGTRFTSIGVTIETVDAVARINEILDAGDKLTCVTIGRLDLNASYGGAGVDDKRTMDMVRIVVRAAAQRNLEVTMGGSVNTTTRTLLLADPKLANAISSVETRKVVLPMDMFLHSNALENAIETEVGLIEIHAGPLRHVLSKGDARVAIVRRRLGKT